VLSITGEYNDNITLSPDEEDEVWGTILVPSLRANYLTETLELRGRAALEIERYSGDDELDTENQFYDWFSRYQATERNTLALSASFRRESILRVGRVTEAVGGQAATRPIPATPPIPPTPPIPGTSATPGGEETVDIGLVNRQVQRDSLLVSPSWTWRVTERSRLTLNYRFDDVSYPDAEPVDRLVDHNSHRGGGTLGYRLTERDEVTGTLTYTRANFEDEPSDRTYDDWALTAGISRDFSETLNGTLEGGVRFTSFERDGEDEEDDTGYLIRLRLRQRGELTLLDLRAEHDLVPSGAGALLETNRIALLIDRKLTPRFSASFLAEYFQQDSLEEEAGTSDERRFYRLNPALRWHWTPELEMDLGYRYVNQERDDESAVSNAAFITLSYRWPRIAVSR
jgi:hypothetical protein